MDWMKHLHCGLRTRRMCCTVTSRFVKQRICTLKCVDLSMAPQQLSYTTPGLCVLHTKAICRGRGVTQALCYGNRSATEQALGKHANVIVDCDWALRHPSYPRDKRCKILQRRAASYYALGRIKRALKNMSEAQADIDQQKVSGAKLSEEMCSIEKQLKSSVNVATAALQRKRAKRQRNKQSLQTRALQELPNNENIANASEAVSMHFDNIQVNKYLDSDISENSDSISSKVMSASNRGRYLVAKREIHPGEAVIEEDAYSAVLKREEELDRCHHCFMQVPLMPCPRCAYARFCSDKCLTDAAWYHDHECGHSFFRSMPTLVLVAVRILFRRQTERIQQRLALDPKLETLGLNNNRQWKGQYDSVYSLLPHYLDHSSKDLAANVWHAVVCTQSLHRMFETLGNIDGDNKQQLARRLFHHLCQLPTNVYGMFEVVSSNKTARVSSQSQKRISEVVYPTCSLLNHSCQPNTLLNYSGRKLTIRASARIPVSSEITNCYGPDTTTSTQDRQRTLRNTYFFLCKCVACSQNVLKHHKAAQPRCILSPECEGTLQEVPGQTYLQCWHCNCTVEKTEPSAKSILQQHLLARCLYFDGTDLLEHQRDEPESINSPLALLLHCLAIRRELLAPTDIWLGSTEQQVAVAHCHFGEYQYAAPYMLNAIMIAEHHYGFHSTPVARSYKMLCTIYFNGKMLQEGRDAIAKTTALYKVVAPNKVKLFMKLARMDALMSAALNNTLDPHFEWPNLMN
eukprot:TRINITY_DN1452_c0_g1_i1.p1 TRINITY_DN1452_c0_g1~~TRINITY_DN1452_c0_g1_i1.p1  ORF type:complete len:743 (-),score=69.15 TRINITY_DN1452_c0_g1_i1:30-2258(-)